MLALQNLEKLILLEIGDLKLMEDYGMLVAVAVPAAETVAVPLGFRNNVRQMFSHLTHQQLPLL